MDGTTIIFPHYGNMVSVFVIDFSMFSMYLCILLTSKFLLLVTNAIKSLCLNFCKPMKQKLIGKAGEQKLKAFLAIALHYPEDVKISEKYHLIKRSFGLHVALWYTYTIAHHRCLQFSKVPVL